MPTKTLILGGIKSGKSRFAENTANEWNGTTTVIATATANDEEMIARIERHKLERNPNFNVTEEPIFLAEAIRQHDATECLIVDCLTLWMSNLLLMTDSQTTLDNQKSEFMSSIHSSTSRILLVSNETNMGIIPMGQLSRSYCDEIGMLHQELASVCDEVYLMVAGIPLKISS